MKAEKTQSTESSLKEAKPAFGWLIRDDYKPENRKRHLVSIDIVLQVLDILHERGMQIKDLAKKMDANEKEVERALRGKQSVTPEMRLSFERALDVRLSGCADS